MDPWFLDRGFRFTGGGGGVDLLIVPDYLFFLIFLKILHKNWIILSQRGFRTPWTLSGSATGILVYFSWYLKKKQDFKDNSNEISSLKWFLKAVMLSAANIWFPFSRDFHYFISVLLRVALVWFHWMWVEPCDTQWWCTDHVILCAISLASRSHVIAPQVTTCVMFIVFGDFVIRLFNCSAN